MNTLLRKNIDAHMKVSDTEALILMFHHLDMAAALFEAGPLMPEVITAFALRYGDNDDDLGTKSKQKFLECLNQEYVDKFDDEAEEESAGDDESSAVSEGA